MGIARNQKYLRGKLLDFGCSNKPYESLFNVEKYIGLDIEVSGHTKTGDKVDIYYDGKTIPFDDNYFDAVFSSQVFEHVFNLAEVLAELHRVLKPGGHMLVTLPFVWDEHEIPYDFARYTSFGIEHLLKQAGFEVILIEKTTNYVETIFQMWNTYIEQSILPSNRFGLLLIPLVIAPVTLLGIILSKVLPEDRSFYNDNIVVVRKLSSSN